MKIWARLITDGKNVKDTLYADNMPLNFDSYENMLRKVAELLEISSPVTMQIHFKHFKEFNVHRFIPDDFVESFDYDSMEIECYEWFYNKINYMQNF